MGHPFSYLKYSDAVEIWGGKIENIIEMDSGSGPGQFAVESIHIPPLHPDAFAINTLGRVYIHDPANGRIHIYDTTGYLLNEIRFEDYRKKGLKLVIGLRNLDITADNDGNVYLLDYAENEGNYAHRVVKFSSEGEVLNVFVPYEPKPLRWLHSMYCDYFGNTYFYLVDQHLDSTWVVVYDPKAQPLTKFEVYNRLVFPSDGSLVQVKDAKGQLVFLKGDYLWVTNVDNMLSGFKKERVRRVDVPQELLSGPYRFIGFDSNLNIFFSEEPHFRDLGKDQRSRSSAVEILRRYKIERDEKLVETGRVYLNFGDEGEKLDEYPLSTFTKRFLIGDEGEVYFLHGTTRKLYLSRIIFD